MREIKYQGWNGKQILQVVRVHIDDDGAIWWSNDFKQLKIYNAEHNPMRQYTGLHDKNGKEIYESDIVDLLPDGYVKEKAVVVWDNQRGGWGYRRTSEASEGGLVYATWQPLEVIGNIYENPELLKGD